MNLEDMTLSEIKQSHTHQKNPHTQKTNTTLFHLHEKAIIFTEKESRMWFPGVRGMGDWGNGELFNEYKVSVLQDEIVLVFNTGCTTMLI